MTGVIWMVQLVHYPLLKDIPASGFLCYQQKNVQRTTWVVLPAMLIELSSQAALVFLCFYAEAPSPFFWPHILAGLLLVTIWLSTFFLQVPQHQKLLINKNEEAIQKLVRTNWIRTIAWSLRCFLLTSLILSL